MENRTEEKKQTHVEILLSIDEDDLDFFADCYRDHKHVCYASLCLSNGSRIKKSNRSFPIRFMSPVGGWKLYGTFFMVAEADCCYEIGVFAAHVKSQNAQDNIQSSLNLTKRINFTNTNRYVVFRDVHHSFYVTVKAFIASKDLEIQNDVVSHVFKLSREDALNFDIKIPEEVKLRSLQPENAQQIFTCWPYPYPPTKEYIRVMIQTNGGYGLFSSKDGELLSWGLKTMMGTIGFVQTVQKHFRKGYASLIVKILSKELAFECQHSIAMVYTADVKSHLFFESLGYKIIGLSHDIHLKSKKNLLENVSKEKKKKGMHLASFRFRRRNIGFPSKKDLMEAGPSSAHAETSKTQKSKDSPKKNQSQSPDSPVSKNLLKTGFLKARRFSANILNTTLRMLSPTLAVASTATTIKPHSETRQHLTDPNVKDDDSRRTSSSDSNGKYQGAQTDVDMVSIDLSRSDDSHTIR